MTRNNLARNNTGTRQKTIFDLPIDFKTNRQRVIKLDLREIS